MMTASQQADHRLRSPVAQALMYGWLWATRQPGLRGHTLRAGDPELVLPTQLACTLTLRLPAP